MELDPPQKALIFDPVYTGHHLRFVSWVFECFHSAGYKVFFASSKATFESEEYKILLKRYEANFQTIKFQCHTAPGGIGRLDKPWELLKLLMKTDADMVWIPYLDDVFYVFGIIGIVLKKIGWRFPAMHGILMYCGFAHSKRQGGRLRKIKELICRSIIKFGPFSRVFLIDDVAFQYLNLRMNTNRILNCPDPAEKFEFESAVSFRGKLKIPCDAKVIGAFGLLDKNKGIDRLVCSFLNRKKSDREYLLLMGRLEHELEISLTKMIRDGGNQRIIIVNRFVDEQELLEGMATIDVVAVLYPYHLTSASFLVRAAAAGKPILASNVGWIGSVMKKYKLGYMCDVLDESSLNKGLDWAFGNPDKDCPDAPIFAAQNSVERFKQLILESVE